MSSFQFEPDQGACQISHSFEVARELLEASCNTSKVFKPGKEIFHQVAKFAEVEIELGIRFFAIGFPRNDRIHSGCPRLLTNGF